MWGEERRRLHAGHMPTHAGCLQISSNHLPFSQYSRETGITCRQREINLKLLSWYALVDSPRWGASALSFRGKESSGVGVHSSLCPNWLLLSGQEMLHLRVGYISLVARVTPPKARATCHPFSVLPETSCVTQPWADSCSRLRKKTRLGLWVQPPVLLPSAGQASTLDSSSVFGKGVRSPGLASIFN